jgi:hypothetical protein
LGNIFWNPPRYKREVQLGFEQYEAAGGIKYMGTEWRFSMVTALATNKGSMLGTISPNTPTLKGPMPAEELNWNFVEYDKIGEFWTVMGHWTLLNRTYTL